MCPPFSPDNQNGLKRKSKQCSLYANFGGQTKSILVFLKVAYNISKNADELICKIIQINSNGNDTVIITIN